MKIPSIRQVLKAVALTAFLWVAFFTNSIFSNVPVASASFAELSGYAWSSTVGWISFSGTVPGGTSYGVKVDESTGDFSGYAWSSVVGWISFERRGSENPPQEPFNTWSGPIAQIAWGTGKVTGWARAVSGVDTGGWSGWIKLSDDRVNAWKDKGVTSSGGKFSGYAWEPETMGWIDFGPIDHYTSGYGADGRFVGVTLGGGVITGEVPTVVVTVLNASGIPVDSVAFGETFTLSMTSTKSPTLCTWSRTTDNSEEQWTNINLLDPTTSSPATSYSVTSSGWKAGTYNWTFTCTNDTGPGTGTATLTISAPVVVAPVVSTQSATLITTDGATLNATVDSLDSSPAATDRGICYGTSVTTMTNCVADATTATGPFTRLVKGLTSDTTYYYRAYATQSGVKTYSTSDSTFTTLTPVTGTDLRVSSTVTVTPTTAITAGTAKTFSVNITNNGTVGTTKTFPNLFQYSTDNWVTATNVYDMVAANITSLATTETKTASASYTFASAGTYSVRLCADMAMTTRAGTVTEANEDNNCGTAVDVTVEPANTAPTANAGSNKTIALPTNSITVTGTVFDVDTGDVATAKWTQVGSTPSVATIANSTTVSPTFGALVEGTYTFMLTATDNNGATGTSDVNVTVESATAVPVVTVMVNGKSSDTVASGTIFNLTMTSGAATSCTSSRTTVNNNLSGDYTDGASSLSVDYTNGWAGPTTVTWSYTCTNANGRGTGSATLTISAPANTAPTADAGLPQTIMLPIAQVTLSGSAADSDGTVASTLWTKLSGPSGATITSPTAFPTTITGLVQGSYTFRLTATDNNGATGTSDVNVTVESATAVPVVTVMVNGKSSDTVASGTIFNLTMTSGAATSCTSSRTTVNNNLSGDYTDGASSLSVDYTNGWAGPTTVTWSYTCTNANGRGTGSATLTISAPVAKPDLTVVAGSVTPTFATEKMSTTLSATIINQGLLSTGTSFYSFFQIADASQGGGTRTDLTASTITALEPDSSANMSTTHTFLTVGTYSIRACADKLSSGDAGGIDEGSNENNNCGGWVDVSVTNPNAPSGTITGDNRGEPGTYTFTVTGTDPNGNAVRYGIDWNPEDGKGEADEWLVGNITYPGNITYVLSGISQEFSHTWTADGTYEFQVIVQDIQGNNSVPVRHTIVISTFVVPPIIITPVRETVAPGGETYINWNISEEVLTTSDCVLAGGGLNYSIQLASSYTTTGTLAEDTTYTLTCTKTDGTVLTNSTTVTVGAVTETPSTCGALSPTCDAGETISNCPSDCNSPYTEK